MKKYSLIIALALLMACGKKGTNTPDSEEVKNGIIQKTQTLNGITFRSFASQSNVPTKGILVMGSGNDENNPSEGSLDGAAETEMCMKAAANGYAAAIVQYQKPPSGSTWNSRSKLLGEDFDKCIIAMAGIYNIDKAKSVVGGYSYASFMLLTNIAYYNSIPYCKGVLAACGASGTDQATKFKIPVFSITCSGNNEGDYAGKALFDQIPANSPIKAKSAGLTDNSCNQHCAKNWTDEMYARMVTWIQ